MSCQCQCQYHAKAQLANSVYVLCANLLVFALKLYILLTICAFFVFNFILFSYKIDLCSRVCTVRSKNKNDNVGPRVCVCLYFTVTFEFVRKSELS